MGLFDFFKKKEKPAGSSAQSQQTSPPAIPAGWKTYEIGGVAYLSLPPDWEIRDDSGGGRFKVRSGDDEVTLSLTPYQIETSKWQGRDASIPGLLQNWLETGFEKDGEVQNGTNYMCQRMHMTGDTFHLMAGGFANKGANIILGAFIFTGMDRSRLDQDEAMLINILKSLR